MASRGQCVQGPAARDPHGATRHNYKAIQIIIQHIQAKGDEYRGFCFESPDATTSTSQPEMIRYILNQRVTTQGVFSFGRGSTLYISLRKDTPEIFDILLGKGLNLYVKGKLGYTPFDDMSLRHDRLDLALKTIGPDRLKDLPQLPKSRMSLKLDLNGKKYSDAKDSPSLKSKG